MKAERWRFKAGAHRELCAFLLTISIFQRFYYNKRKIFYQCFVGAARSRPQYRKTLVETKRLKK
jgi:hypothetical protein